MKTTTLCFLRKDDEVLLAMKKRGFGAGKWNGVGGKLKPDETPDAAACREIKEEIGVDVAPKDLILAGVLHFHYEGNSDWDQTSHIFVIKRWNGVPTESEEMRPAWYPITMLPFDAMWVDDPHWVPLVLAGKRLDANFIFNQNGTVMQSCDVRIVG